MKNKFSILSVCLSLFLLSGCTPVKIFSDSRLTERTGLKYYSVRPYLQVEREPESNRIVKAVVLYLPDLSDPQFMQLNDGPGSRKFDIKFTDGTISTFGYSSDAKIAESVNALASLISKGTSAVTDLNSLKGIESLKAVPNTVELYEIVIGPDKTTLRTVSFDK